MSFLDRSDSFYVVIYFFFPETARLTLEEIAMKFGEEVAVNLTDATDEEKIQIARDLTRRPERSVLTDSTRDREVTGVEQEANHGTNKR